MKVLGRIFLNSRTDGKTVFFVSCRRTYVLKNHICHMFLQIMIGSWVLPSLYHYLDYRLKKINSTLEQE